MPIKPARFSVTILMTVVAILGVGLGVMRDGSETADQVVFSGTIMALLVGLLGALVRREAGAWVGFALFGWSFLLLSFLPILDEKFGDRLLSRPLIETLAERFNEIPPMPPSPPFQQATDSSGNQDGKMVDGKWMPMSPEEVLAFKDYLKKVNEHWSKFNQPLSSQKMSNSRRIGYSLLTLLIATFGAIVGQWLSTRTPTIAASLESGPTNPAA